MNPHKLFFLLAALTALPQLPALASEHSAGKNEPTAGRTCRSEKVSADLPNFHEVHPFLYRSGEPTADGLKKVQEMGVKTIIDLRAPSERKFDEETVARNLGMTYVHMTMSSKAPTKEQVDRFLAIGDAAKSKPESGKVLLHCAHGSDRTGCLIGIWRVSRDNWSYEDAYKEMRKYYFGPKYLELSGAVRHRAKS